jgi:glyoxylase-like metal-dependent hydrolase (beta-lactamase superfamily II)
MYGQTTPVDEGFLAGLGVHRFAVPTPFADAGGPVNAYAIEDEGGTWTMFDTGVGTPEGTQVLDAALAQAGIDATRLSRIIVSHGHVDHYGNAELLARKSGAPVYVTAGDLEKVVGDGRWYSQMQQNLSFYETLGLPAELFEGLKALTQQAGTFALQVERARVVPLTQGQRFRFRHFDAEVLALPGHTPGLTCLHAPQARLLFSDDHVLERVSPNPLLDFSQGAGPTRFQALVRYMESARTVQALELDCVLPGHGPAFTGHRSLFDGLFEFYGRRQAKMVARMQAGPASVYELVCAVFPRVDLKRLFLMLSEVMATPTCWWPTGGQAARWSRGRRGIASAELRARRPSPSSLPPAPHGAA